MSAPHAKPDPSEKEPPILKPWKAWTASALTIVLLLAVLSVLPSKSVVATDACGSHLDLFCRMDAHQGVVTFLTLVIALVAGVMAYLSLHGAGMAAAQAQAHEKQEKHSIETRYKTLVLEMSYECVHNLHHLMDMISWTPPADDDTNEYEGCALADRADWPFLDFRYADRLFDVAYVGLLERDAPAVLGFLDHALRNARYIEQSAHSSAPAAPAKPLVWMSEHLLRVLVCLRYRASVDPSAEDVAGIAKRVLVAAKLDDLLNPGPRTTRTRLEAGLAAITDEDAKTPISIDIELRDRVRFVRHKRDVESSTRTASVSCGTPKKRDGREFDTSVACFEPKGGKMTPLLEELKRMPDPPPRP